jgi:hypothetical protein
MKTNHYSCDKGHRSLWAKGIQVADLGMHGERILTELSEGINLKGRQALHVRISPNKGWT